MIALQLENVSRDFGGVKAVSNFDMGLRKGEITGLIGPNGAGKSTIVNLTSGMLKVSSGTVRFNGRDISHESPFAVATMGISRTFQNIRLLGEASVLDNIMVGFERHRRTSTLQNLLGMPAIWRERNDFIVRAEALLSRFDMQKFRDYPAGQLSYGHQRRVEMMRALAMEPEVLLLDEPVAGMNDVEADELGVLFSEVADSGVAVLLIEHNVRFVRSLCRVVYAMNAGVLITSGSADDVCGNPEVIEAYLGA